MAGGIGGSFDLPFEPTTGKLEDEHVHYSSAVVVMAATVPVDYFGVMPALVFRFTEPTTGELYPPFCLVLDDEHMSSLRPLIHQAIHAAREAAKKAAT